jgi:hypothetical protein
VKNRLLQIMSLIRPPKIGATLPTFYPLCIQPLLINGLEVTEFWISTMLLKSVLDRTAAELNLTFGSWLSQISGSPKYHFCRQLSQLSDGPFSGSKWLDICALQLTELDRVAESGIVDIPYPSAQIRLSVNVFHDHPGNFEYQSSH